MPTSPREKTIVRSILKKLNALPKCKAIKIHGGMFTAEAGTPDILGCIDGQMFALEVKRPGNSATLLQLRRLVEWKKAGAMSFIVTDTYEAVALVKQERENAERARKQDAEADRDAGRDDQGVEQDGRSKR